MEQGHKKKAQHPHHPHHQVPKHESGYTDEVAIEAHDLIDKAEEDAHLHDPNSMYSTTDKAEPIHRLKKGGLEGSGGSGGGGSSTGNKKGMPGEKMGQEKKGMKK